MFSRVTGSSPDRTPAVRILVVGNAGELSDAKLDVPQSLL